MPSGSYVLSNQCSSIRQHCLHTHPLQTAGKDFVIPANHRVVRVRAEAGWQRWAAGATCLNFLEIEVAPGEQQTRLKAPTGLRQSQIVSSLAQHSAPQVSSSLQAITW